MKGLYRIFIWTSVLVLLCSAANAINISSGHVDDDNLGIAGGQGAGIFIEMNHDWNLTAFLGFGANDVTHGRVYWANTTLIASTTMNNANGDYAQFEGGVLLEAGHSYIFHCHDDGGGNQLVRFKTNPNYPNNYEPFKALAGNYVFTVNYSTRFLGFVSFEGSNLTGPGDTTAPSITIQTPNNGSHNNALHEYQFINVSIDEPGNCTLNADNSSLDYTWYWGNTTYASFIINQTATETSYFNYNISCFDDEATPNNGSSRLEFWIDVISPVATTNISGLLFEQNFSYQINYTDDLQVFSFNISIDDTLVYNISNLTGTLYQYNGTIDPDKYSVKEHNISTWICDAHTKNKIKSWDNRLDYVNKKIEFDNKFDIYPEDKTWVDTHYLEKKTDRYEFSYRIKNKKQQYSFFVESEEYIYIISKSEYRGHIVTANRWVDFEMDESSTIVIERINDKKVKVTVSNFAGDELKFKSAGELNCNQYVWNWYNLNESVAYPTDVIEGDLATFKLVIDVGSSDSSIIGNVSTFYYNGTQYPTTRINSSNQINFTTSITVPVAQSLNETPDFWWEYTKNSENLNTSVYNNTKYMMNLTMCYNSNQSDTYAINYSIFDEQSNIKIPANFTSLFEIYINETFLKRNVSLSRQGLSNYSICIHPHWAIYNSDITIQYSSGGYDNRDYVKTAYTIDNTTDFVSLYLLKSAVSSSVTVHVTDDNDVDLENILIEMWLWDITNNNFKRVESEYTNTEGQSKFSYNPADQYKFLLYQDGVLKIETIKMKITTTLQI